MKVTKLEVSTVYPSERCEPHVMYLSGADHIVRPRHVPIFLFYRAREDGEQVSISFTSSGIPLIQPLSLVL